MRSDHLCIRYIFTRVDLGDQDDEVTQVQRCERPTAVTLPRDPRANTGQASDVKEPVRGLSVSQESNIIPVHSLILWVALFLLSVGESCGVTGLSGHAGISMLLLIYAAWHCGCMRP